MADLVQGRLFRFVALSSCLYAITAALTPAPTLILVLNDLLMSAAAGVRIAYLPLVPDALSSRKPTKGDYLGCGIFFVSLCMLVLRIVAAKSTSSPRPEVRSS